jgi:hypothetical protein
VEYAEGFVAWIEGLGLEPNRLYGEPLLKEEIMEDPACGTACGGRDLDDDEGDEVC